MEINVPNVPNVIGKAIGKVVHLPIDVACGIKEGFTGVACATRLERLAKKEAKEALKLELKNTEETELNI